MTHSKGGLDVRVYLAYNPLDNSVSNLIMIGTPNKGSPMADRDYKNDQCKLAIYDLLTNSSSLHVPKNIYTKYYTIACNWITQFTPGVLIDSNCIDFSYWYGYQLYSRAHMDEPDDGIVPLWSSQLKEFIPLGITDSCHTDLLDKESYDIASGILKE